MDESMEDYERRLMKECAEEMKELREMGENDPDEGSRQFSRQLHRFYDLTPEEATSEEHDFVYGFLFENRTGYCVHFATALVILARLNDIPARFATGFVVNVGRGEPKIPVTGLSAHAWPEVWIEGKGWLVLEVTPPFDNRNYQAYPGEWIPDYLVDLDPFTENQIESIMGIDVADSPTQASIAPRSEARVGRFRLVILSVLGLIILAAAITISLYITIRKSSLEKKFYFKLKGVVKYFCRKGMPHPEDVGWLEWAGSARRGIPSRSKDIQKLTDIIVKSNYADYSIRSEDWILLSRLSKTLHKN